ncbi:membrane-associated kinase regulator [Vigna angularis]|uniref:Membrane-associated kinase regulator n=1 Tax=Phaseolus angularis TaxID=3914 RepID=A0A8T0LBI5_PHAAN|nr:membrane-associated kinase regulator [Vigna angularis]
METSLPLATDSFSYGWLSNCKPFANDLQELLRESSSTCNSPLMEEWQSFNFDISFTHSPAVLAHADELFSNGLIKPLFVGPSKLDSCKTTQDSTLQSQPVSSFSSRIVSPRTLQIHHGFLTRWKTSTCRTLRNLSRYVNQLCQRVASSRKNTKVDDFDKEDWLVNSWSSSHQASPKSSSISPIGALHDHENSIYEAVLHCKRSIDNPFSNKEKIIVELPWVVADKACLLFASFLSCWIGSYCFMVLYRYDSTNCVVLIFNRDNSVLLPSSSLLSLTAIKLGWGFYCKVFLRTKLLQRPSKNRTLVYGHRISSLLRKKLADKGKAKATDKLVNLKKRYEADQKL